MDGFILFTKLSSTQVSHAKLLVMTLSLNDSMSCCAVVTN